MRIIPNNLIDKFLLETIKYTNTTFHNTNIVSNTVQEQMRTVIVQTDQPEVYLNGLNFYISKNLSTFLEKETKEEVKEYNRSIDLFENSIIKNTVIFIWRKD